jgi:hypothetical protein
MLPNSTRRSTRPMIRSPRALPTAPYDQDRVYDAVAEHFLEAVVVVPPRSTAVRSQRLGRN